MDKSGSRPTAAQLIIDRPEQQTQLQRATYGILTLFFWAIWVNLWLPLVTLVGWMLGINRFVEVMMFDGGFDNLWRVFAWYGVAIALFSGSLVAWAVYNWIRFRTAGRRGRQSSPLRMAKLAQRLRTDPETMALWHRAKRIRTRFNENGQFVGVLLDSAIWKDAAPEPTAANESRSIKDHQTERLTKQAQTR